MPTTTTPDLNEGDSTTSRLNTQRVTSDDSLATMGVAGVMKDINRAAGEKVTFTKMLVTGKICQNAIQKEEHLDLFKM